VEKALQLLGLASSVRVGMDVEAAHMDAFGGGPGVLLVAGTGSMAWSRDEQGESHRSGGWGSMMGEEGSGYWVAVQGLRAAARGLDGRGPATRLTSLLPEALGLSDLQSVVPWAASASKADVAALAPVILEAAQAGDGPASDVRTSALEELGSLASSAIRAMESHEAPPPVALVGGMVEPGSSFRSLVAREVERVGGCYLDQPVLPVRGAARLALTLVPPGMRPSD
jgi:glucosamine kinase